MKTTGTTLGWLSVVVVLFLTLVFGCDMGKSGPADKAGQKDVKRIVFDPKNPCNLLTKEEVESVMKQKIGEPQPQDHACSYESVDSTKLSSLLFTVSDVDAAESVKGMRDHFEKSGMPVKAVAGVGDGAYFQEKDLHVLKGKYLFSFQSVGNKGYELGEDAIKTLAKTAVDKLP